MAKPKKDGHPFCFRCKYFYRGEGEKYVSAHCPFQIYVGCEGRTKAVDLGEEYLKREERACGYFGMTYFHIVQKLFLYHTRHSGGSSTFQKCYELGIDDPSKGVKFPLWKTEWES